MSRLKNISDWWAKQSESVKVLIFIGIVSIIGIIWRWKYIIYAIAKSFNRYKGYAD